MNAHTPGPWKADRMARGRYQLVSLYGGSAQYLGMIDAAKLRSALGTDPDEVKNEANARLIAKAPELYATLQTVESYLHTMKAAGLIAGEPWMEQARALLAEIDGTP